MSYFKPLRRKLGVVTLLMACAFTAGWVRSIETADSVSLRMETQSIDIVLSEHGELEWRRLRDEEYQALPSFEWFTSDLSSELLIDDSDPRVWRWHFCGLGFGDMKYTDAGSAFLSIPYWLIVLPLTLLSAWLMLSKPGAEVKSLTTAAIESAR